MPTQLCLPAVLLAPCPCGPRAQDTQRKRQRCAKPGSQLCVPTSVTGEADTLWGAKWGSLSLHTQPDDGGSAPWALEKDPQRTWEPQGLSVLGKLRSGGESHAGIWPSFGCLPCLTPATPQLPPPCL